MSAKVIVFPLFLPPNLTAQLNKRGGVGPFMPYMPPPTWNPRVITGVTRDVNLNPIAGCTVQLVNGAGVVITTTTADGGGNYSFPSVGIGQLYSIRAVDPTGALAGATIATIAGQ